MLLAAERVSKYSHYSISIALGNGDTQSACWGVQLRGPFEARCSMRRATPQCITTPGARQGQLFLLVVVVLWARLTARTVLCRAVQTA